ncbi:RNA recognition motif domain-containing protein [Flavitalea flava]
MNMYVSNLGFQVTDQDLKTLFEGFGKVTSAKIINDKETGRSRGFGFVEMPQEAEAEEAMQKLKGSEMEGRTLSIEMAKPRPDTPYGDRNSRWQK